MRLRSRPVRPLPSSNGWMASNWWCAAAMRVSWCSLIFHVQVFPQVFQHPVDAHAAEGGRVDDTLGTGDTGARTVSYGHCPPLDLRAGLRDCPGRVAQRSEASPVRADGCFQVQRAAGLSGCLAWPGLLLDEVLRRRVDTFDSGARHCLDRRHCQPGGPFVPEGFAGRHVVPDALVRRHDPRALLPDLGRQQLFDGRRRRQLVVRDLRVPAGCCFCLHWVESWR